jgi:hypothetical protein
MKNKYIGIAVVSVGISTLVQGQTNIIIAPTEVSYDSVNVLGEYLDITYSVTEYNNSFYLYQYELSAPSDDPFTSFTIGGSHDPVLTSSLDITEPGLSSSDEIENSDSVLWEWNGDVFSDTVGYTSVYSPGTASFTLNDDDVVWASPPPIPSPDLTSIPAPEPPSSIILFGGFVVSCCSFIHRRALKRN